MTSRQADAMRRALELLETVLVAFVRDIAAEADPAVVKSEDLHARAEKVALEVLLHTLYVGLSAEAITAISQQSGLRVKLTPEIVAKAQTKIDVAMEMAGFRFASELEREKPSETFRLPRPVDPLRPSRRPTCKRRYRRGIWNV